MNATKIAMNKSEFDDDVYENVTIGAHGGDMCEIEKFTYDAKPRTSARYVVAAANENKTKRRRILPILAAVGVLGVMFTLCAIIVIQLSSDKSAMSSPDSSHEQRTHLISGYRKGTTIFWYVLYIQYTFKGNRKIFASAFKYQA